MFTRYQGFDTLPFDLFVWWYMVVFSCGIWWYFHVFSLIKHHKAMGATKHRDQFRAERFSDRSFNADLPEMAPERESLKNHL